MENASKALIMAGGILIAIMVISLGVYIFSKFGDFAKNQETQVFEKNVTEFNAQFTKFEGAEDITAQDVVTVINIARNNNKMYNLEDSEGHKEGNYYVNATVTVNGKTYNQNQNYQKESPYKNNLNTFLKDNSFDNAGNLILYKCNIKDYDDITGRVCSIEFSKK